MNDDLKLIMLAVIVTLVLVFAVGSAKAENSSKEINFPKSALVEGLKDCRFFVVRIGRNMLDQYLTVVRCPNSETSANFKSGKADMNVITVEDIARQAVLNKLTPTERKLIGVEK